MHIRLLENRDKELLEEYLAPYKTECMFICSNLQNAGIEYKGAAFEGEYFGCFSKSKDKDIIDTDAKGEVSAELMGVIVHYWSGSIMMHALTDEILEGMIFYLKKHITRPLLGVLGINNQAQQVINNFGLATFPFRINRNEGLYELRLENLHKFNMAINMKVVKAQEVAKDILIKWLKDYEVEALGAIDNDLLHRRIVEELDRRLFKHGGWVLLVDENPVALSAFNARVQDVLQVGPVYTPIEYRNKGYAKMLLSYILHQKKLSGSKQAILFTGNPSAIKAYEAMGFNKVGNYRIALLEKPISFL